MPVKHKPNSKLISVIITLAIIFLTGGFMFIEPMSKEQLLQLMIGRK